MRDAEPKEGTRSGMHEDDDDRDSGRDGRPEGGRTAVGWSASTVLSRARRDGRTAQNAAKDEGVHEKRGGEDVNTAREVPADGEAGSGTRRGDC